MKTTTLGLLGAERVGGRGGSRCPGLPRLPGDPPAGEITCTARLATFSAQTSGRNILSRPGGRVTAPDSAAALKPPLTPNTSHPLPQSPPGWAPPPVGAGPGPVSGTDLWTCGKYALMKWAGLRPPPPPSLERLGGFRASTWKLT